MTCTPARQPLGAASCQGMRSGGRVVEGARLESEYTPKAYRGFESLPLRQLSVILPARLALTPEWRARHYQPFCRPGGGQQEVRARSDYLIAYD